jgi:hypothetical protein
MTNLALMGWGCYRVCSTMKSSAPIPHATIEVCPQGGSFCEEICGPNSSHKIGLTRVVAHSL